MKNNLRLLLLLHQLDLRPNLLAAENERLRAEQAREKNERSEKALNKLIESRKRRRCMIISNHCSTCSVVVLIPTEHTYGYAYAVTCIIESLFHNIFVLETHSNFTLTQPFFNHIRLCRGHTP